MRQIHLPNEKATLKLGESIAHYSEELGVIFLQGQLGCGKTTLARGFLDAMGHRGFVKSPSFAIVEPYEDTKKPVYHFDLYRMSDPDELEYIGFRDYLVPENICLFEWPEHAARVLPPPDLRIVMDFDREGRMATLDADTAYGKYVLEQLEKHW